MHCTSCKQNFNPIVEDASIEDFHFDGTDTVWVTITMDIACSKCGDNLGSCSGISSVVVPHLVDYLWSDAGRELNVNDTEFDRDPEIVSAEATTWYGYRAFVANWNAKMRLGRKGFYVKGKVILYKESVKV